MAQHDDRWRDESSYGQRGTRGFDHDDDHERSSRNFGDRFSRDMSSRDTGTRDWGFADDEDGYGIRARGGYQGGSQGASSHDDDWGSMSRGGQYRQQGNERQFGSRGSQGGYAGQGERGGFGYGGGGYGSGSGSGSYGSASYSGSGGYGGGYGSRSGSTYGGFSSDTGSYGSSRSGGSSIYTGQQASWSAPSTFGTTGSHGGYGQDYREHGYSARDRSGGSSDRGFFERAGDEIASWFGDDEAARRREADHRGRGPKDYTRSDERIREDANDRLTDDYRVDASHVSVMVKDGELTLNGTVSTRDEKRRAEDCVDNIPGVKHVQNNLRVQPQTASSGMSGTGASGPSGLSGVSSGGTTTGASATGTTTTSTPVTNGNGSGSSGSSSKGSSAST